jgi:hypothetical protein
VPRLVVVSLALLIAFWTAIVVITATTFALALRPGQQDDATLIATPVASPAPPFERPAAVPPSAQLIETETTLGDDTPSPGTPFAEQHIFYSLNCRNDLLTVATSQEIVYATLECGEYWLADDVIRAFLANPVRVRVVPGAEAQLTFESSTGLVARFVAETVWIEEI